jgi:hypothetical protein
MENEQDDLDNQSAGTTDGSPANPSIEKRNIERQPTTTSAEAPANTSIDLAALNTRIAAHTNPTIRAGFREVRVLEVQEDRVRVEAEGQETFIALDDNVRGQLERSFPAE